MISPYEIFAFLFMLPIIAAGVWLNNRYDTDGPRVTDFEDWCSRERPLLFAIRCEPEAGSALCAALLARIGPLAKVQHHRGRFPWTRYVFELVIEFDATGVVRGRVERATIRRLQQTWPDMCSALDDCLAAGGLSGAAWVHTELHDGDEVRGVARRGRGWNASIDRGVLKEFAPTAEAPDWALLPQPIPQA